MSTRIAKIPYSNTPVKITFEMPKEETRKAIEERYGHELPPKAWAQVAIATAGYLAAVRAERNAMPVDTLREALQNKLLPVLQGIRTQIDSNPETPNLDYLKDAHATPVHPSEALLQQLVKAIDHLTVVAGAVSKELMGPPSLVYRKGVAWDSWVCFITMIVKDHGLPFEVRKDSDKRKPDQLESPFVRLIEEMEARLLREEAKPFQSERALAQQICRARKDINLDIKFFDALGIVEPMSEGLMNLRKNFE